MKIKEKIIIFLSFLSFITPNAFVKIKILNTLFIGLAVICFSILVLEFIKSKKYNDIDLITLIIWRTLIFIPTLINKGEIVKWGYQSMVFIGIYLLVKNHLNSKKNIKLIYKLTFSYILINLILMIFMPKGIFPQYGIHLLGIRTRFTEYSIALIYISLLYYYNYTKKKKKDRNIRNISILIALINICIQKVATGIISCLAIIIMFLIINNLKKFKYLKITYLIGYTLLLIITYNLIKGNILNLFSNFFKLLDKDVTLTGRTIIWENALILIQKHFFIGSGYLNDGNMVNYAGGLWQAHNTLLQSMCESGIAGTIMLFFIILKQGFPSSRIKKQSIRKLNITIMFGILITMMTEILYYYPIFILILYLIGNQKKLLKNTKGE